MNAPENGFRIEPAASVIGVALTPEEKRRQRARSLAIAWALGALVVLFFLVTMVRMGPEVSMRVLGKPGPDKIGAQPSVQRSI